MTNQVFFFFSFWNTNSFSFVKEKIYTLCSRTDFRIVGGQKSLVNKFLCDIFIFFARMSQNHGFAEPLVMDAMMFYISSQVCIDA